MSTLWAKLAMVMALLLVLAGMGWYIQYLRADREEIRNVATVLQQANASQARTINSLRKNQEATDQALLQRESDFQKVQKELTDFQRRAKEKKTRDKVFADWYDTPLPAGVGELYQNRPSR